MEQWLNTAIDYANSWIEFQMRQTMQPGCAIAIARGQDVVYEKAFGLTNVQTGERLSERHRFRIASLSKTFTAVGILMLAEAGKLKLDDPVGTYVSALHPAVAATTLRQLLSHSAGLARDGDNAGYFADMLPFPTGEKICEELRKPPVIEAGTRFKYSNYGYGLLGLVIEAITGRSYNDWISQQIVAPLSLTETTTDIPDNPKMFAYGHSGVLPRGARVVIPGTNKTNAFSAVTGFTSTAADTARFYAQLSPRAAKSILSQASRGDMSFAPIPDVDSTSGRSYGLGIHVGQLLGWEYFGHIGRFQGTTTRVAMIPELDLTIVIFTNAIDGPSIPWLDGIMHILRRFYDCGPPIGHASDAWTGRWWNVWSAMDLVALGSTVYAFNPAIFPPFFEASEITLDDADNGRVTKAPAMERFGEPVRRMRNETGVTGIRVGSSGFVSERALTLQLEKKYAFAAHVSEQ